MRGRLGMRAGLSLKSGTMTIEPFVIGSLRHEFAGSNQALVTSGGTSFSLLDTIDATWGELSAGLNLFSAGAGSSGFAKIDVAFGDGIDGVGGELGMRLRW